jgi:SagB-type dehydrogenase family enzyme
MTLDENINAVLDYHRATNHTVESVNASNDKLDFSNLPRLYKLYRRLGSLPLPLPDGKVTSTFPALGAISCNLTPSQTESIPNLEKIAMMLKLSAGITKWLTVPGGRMAFRAASCTGAMYHVEMYVVCGDLPQLRAGVYQYGAHDNSLRQIRVGDFRGALIEATSGNRDVANAPATIVYTSVFWRNAWKYKSRAYRHAFWDGGTILANTLAIASSLNVSAKVVTGFVDEYVNQVVDVDGLSEAALFLVPVGRVPLMAVDPAPAPERLKLQILPYSPQEFDYPLIRSTHLASSFTDTAGVEQWRGRKMTFPVPDRKEGLTPLSASVIAQQPREPINEVILHRGSTRRFKESPISFEHLSTILSMATMGVDADYVKELGFSLNDIYLIVNAVTGLPSGSYVYHQRSQDLELLEEGNFRVEAGHLGLNQALAHDAAVNMYFMTDLKAIMRNLGPRGYRVAQLDASTTAGRLYLSAYALHLGATGLTFFDDEVTAFLSPHAAGKSVMFLLLLGVPYPRRTTGPAHD